jgi:hypothetical protein
MHHVQVQEQDPKGMNLEYDQIISILKDLGFLAPKETEAQTLQVDDLYLLLGRNKTESLQAEDLQTVLLVIGGLRDPSTELPS